MVDDPAQEPEEAQPPETNSPHRFQVPERLLGLTAIQRFLVSLVIFLMTVALGVLILLVTHKIEPF
jgi:hypothetical protein